MSQSADANAPLPTKEQFAALHWAKVRSPSSTWRGDRWIAEECERLGWLAGGLRSGGDELNHLDYVYSLTELGKQAYLSYRAAYSR